MFPKQTKKYADIVAPRGPDNEGMIIFYINMCVFYNILNLQTKKQSMLHVHNQKIYFFSINTHLGRFTQY